MDENQVAQQFANIIETEKLINHPRYKQLILKLDTAAVQLFNFMEDMGFGDIGSVVSNVKCPKGHMHPVFKYTCLLIEDDDEG